MLSCNNKSLYCVQRGPNSMFKFNQIFLKCIICEVYVSISNADIIPERVRCGSFVSPMRTKKWACADRLVYNYAVLRSGRPDNMHLNLNQELQDAVNTTAYCWTSFHQRPSAIYYYFTHRVSKLLTYYYVTTWNGWSDTKKKFGFVHLLPTSCPASTTRHNSCPSFYGRRPGIHMQALRRLLNRVKNDIVHRTLLAVNYLWDEKF